MFISDLNVWLQKLKLKKTYKKGYVNIPIGGSAGYCLQGQSRPAHQTQPYILRTGSLLVCPGAARLFRSCYLTSAGGGGNSEKYWFAHTAYLQNTISFSLLQTPLHMGITFQTSKVIYSILSSQPSGFFCRDYFLLSMTSLPLLKNRDIY